MAVVVETLPERIRRLTSWWPAVLLGFATIGAYGTVQYSIGVLIPVIESDTGWSTGLLSLAVSLGFLAQGLVALLAGRTFDRRGSVPVLVPAIVVGAALLLVASFAGHSWQFVLAWAFGASVVAGGLFYNMTMPITARLYPTRRAAAFSVLTLLGALASPIFYPIAGWMAEAWGWRAALESLVALMVLCVAPAAFLVRAPASTPSGTAAGRLGLRLAIKEPVIYRLLLVVAIGGLANSALLLHQVPAIQATGVSLAAASWFAGARGALQIPGRLLLTPLVSRLGVRGTIAVCYGLAATAALALFIALQGSMAFVLTLYFCVVSGMSLGLLSPLNGLFQAQVFGDERLGILSGVAVTVASLAGAAGALLSGVLVDVTGSYEAPLAFVVLLQAVAVAGITWQRNAERDRLGVVQDAITLSERP